MTFPCLQNAIHPKNLTADLAHRASTQPAREALVLPGVSVTFARLNELAWRAAHYFHNCGVRQGQVVATLIKDDLLGAAATLGLARLGATVARLNSSSTQTQLQSQTKQVNAICLIAQENWHSLTIPTFILDQAVLDRSDQGAPPAPESKGPAFLVFGSGSTGNPKIMVLSAQNLFSFCHLGEGEPLYQRDSRVLFLFGLEYVVPMIRLFVLMHTGGTLVLTGNKRIDLLRYCNEQNVTLIQGVAMHFEQLLASVRARGEGLFSTVGAVRVGGAIVSASLRERIRRYIAPVVSVAYAANECGVITELLDDGTQSIAPGSVGRPVNGVTIQIISDSGQVLDIGQVGKIRVKTPCLISGYLDDPDDTQARFRNDWFETGDLGSVSKDGSLIYHGRADAMMIFNGINIFPAEIENCLKQIDDIIDIHVFPVRHHIHQDVPACAVTLKKGSLFTERELILHSQKHLGFRAPKMLFVFDSLPRTPGGKLEREEFLKCVRGKMEERGTLIQQGAKH